jgi:biotin carboxyl carrier protein
MKWHVFVDRQVIDLPDPPFHSIEEVEPGVYSVLYKGRSFEACMTHTPDGLAMAVKGRLFLVDIVDPRNYSAREHAGGAPGRQEIRSPMPGKIVRLLVSPGDHVQAGQGLVVVEAMKMQNEMKASREGTVSKVSVSAGDTVTAGDILVILE